MRRLIMAVCLLILPAVALSAEPASFAGDWVGTLDAGVKLRLAMQLVNKDGVWSGTLESVDQGGGKDAFSSLTVDGMKLHFEVAAYGAAYDGTLDDAGNTIAGTFSQNGASLPLTFTRGEAGQSKGPNRPQEPKPPFPYHSEDVTVPGPDGISLAGTFTAPNGEGPFPAVLLITGSGPENRDEAVFGHKPFFVLSDHLTRNGIAVLRLDDRGVGKSTGNYASSTTGDFANDAASAVAYLKTRSEVDGKKIGLIGHSDGGLISALTAIKSKDVAFIVMLAGVGVPADDVMVRQASLIMKASGASDAMIKDNQAAQRQMFAVVRAEKDPAAAEPKLRAVCDDLVKKLAADNPAAAEGARGNIMASIQMVNSPWFRYWLNLDPAATLRQVKAPVLALNGSLDMQVDPKQNLPAIEKALRDGGNQDVTVQELPGLNHLFQTAKTGSPMEYATIEETVSPAVLSTVSDWILLKAKAKKK